MERELWSILQQGIKQLMRSRNDNAYHTHSTATIVRVYLWAALHDRPVCWACDRRAWDHRTRPRHLPHQCTMSRRMRSNSFMQFMLDLGRYLAAFLKPAMDVFKQLDGKPLFVSKHSADKQATFGRGAGQMHRGYKLHAIWGRGVMPLTFEVRGLADDEKLVARELLPQLTGGGYVLADAFYDSNVLHALAASANHQLIAPRKRSLRRKGLGNRRHHPGRLRSLALTEPSRHTNQSFCMTLRNQRRQIETRFGHLVSFHAGLSHLPPWVRTLHRVRWWVTAKLLINAARMRAIHA